MVETFEMKKNTKKYVRVNEWQIKKLILKIETCNFGIEMCLYTFKHVECLQKKESSPRFLNNFKDD